MDQENSQYLVHLGGVESLREASLFEAFGDYVDPRGPYLDDGEQWLPLAGGGIHGPASLLTDQDVWPYVTQEDLQQLRRTCRFVATRTDLGVGVQQKLGDYVVGEGLRYQARAEKRYRESHAELVAQVQRVIDRFLDLNDWAQLDRELFEREVRDGEWFLVLYPQPCGSVKARTVEPELVTQPMSQAEAESWCCDHADGFPADAPLDWSFGLVTHAEDVEEVYGAWLQSAPGSGRFVPASRLVHRKANVTRNMKRGVSDFWPVRRTLWQAQRVLNNTAESVCVQAAIAGVRQHEATTTNAQMDAMNARRLDYQGTHPTVGGYSKTQNISHIKPGTVFDVRGAKYLPGLTGEGADKFIIVLGACMRMAGSRWAMPEYLVSSDASNGNFASTLVAGDPFVKHCERRQREHGAAVRLALWKVLRMAWDSGLLPAAGSWLEVERAIEIDALAPSVEVQNRTEETDRSEKLVQAGVMAKKTWAAREGLDWEDEQLAGAKEAAPPPDLFGQVAAPVAESLDDASKQARAVAAAWACYGGHD